MNSRSKEPVIDTPSEYRQAVRRAADLAARGETAESCEELAALEAAIARYVAKPGHPASRKGRPQESGNGA